MNHEPSLKRTPRWVPSAEHRLFFKRLLKNPRHLGAVWPSSRGLSELIGEFVADLDQPLVVELGAGTGRLTAGLLSCGHPPSLLTCVETDTLLCSFLKKRYPNIDVVEGKAENLQALLHPSWIGRVGVIVSGIPLVNLSRSVQSLIIQSSFSVLEPGGVFLQFTYRAIPPLNPKTYGLKCQRIGHVWANFPPATVWSYSKD
jgi:phosphatidylethanolamine/phosphatidyl-N-methylethanolamine N-methyltransferase